MFYNYRDFDNLYLLKKILASNDEELKSKLLSKLLEAEQQEFKIPSLITKTLNIVHEYSYKLAHITLVRRNPNEK